MSLGLVCGLLFSSRRRHTSWPRDWSSDVCSSDLADLTDTDPTNATRFVNVLAYIGILDRDAAIKTLDARSDALKQRAEEWEIGRATCREREWDVVWAGVWCEEIELGCTVVKVHVL